jgi:hypothetical protein
MKVNVYYNSSELKTLGDFLRNDTYSAAFSYRDRPKEFLDLQDENGIDNYSKILKSYGKSTGLIFDLNDKYESGRFNEITLIPPTVFVIETTDVKVDLFSVQGNLVQSTLDVNYFISKRLSDLVSSPGFRKKSKNTKLGSAVTFYPRMTVWIWSRALHGEYELLNISPFISNITVSSQRQGAASFNFTIAPILADFKGSENSNREEGWVMKNSSFKQFVSELNKGTVYSAQSFINKTRGRETSNSDENEPNLEIVHEQFFFHNIIGSNDLVFISFEQLELETNEYEKEFFVPFSAIRSKNWDLMGLVDSNSITVDGGSSIASIQISGRDYTKAIIEDGCYFWATEFGLDGIQRFAGNTQTRISQRIGVGQGGLASVFSYANKSIEYGIRFVLSQIAHTGLVPSEIFDSYGEDKSTIFQVLDRQSIELSEVPADGIFNVVKIIVDPQVSNLRLVNDSLFVEQGSLINYIQGLCQDPFVEFYTETIKDQFYFIARRPPYGKQQYLDAINGVTIEDDTEIIIRDVGEEPLKRRTPSFVIDIEADNVISDSFSFDDQVYTWFKLEPRFAMSGNTVDVISQAFLPAVFLPTYTNIWGSRPYNATSSYIQYVPTTSTEDQRARSNSILNAAYDLRWVIETHAYLPFSRKGTIEIKEDRRIKKGMHIRYRPTGEIFLVDAVSNTASIGENSIQRSTSLSVSRGLVEEFIEGVEIGTDNNRKKFSYFNLVNMPIDVDNFERRKRERSNREQEKKRNETQKPPSASFELLSDWREDVDVIDFFLKRKQFRYR